MAKVGRNDPCPCGSGKKYKKCCLDKDAAPPPARLDEMDFEEPPAQALVYDGWEALAVEDTRLAKRCFRKALELDPDIADAFNGLAELAARKGDAEGAEGYYRQAYEKAKAALGTEDKAAYAWYGELDTRPYMRARHGLALLFFNLGKYDEAVGEFKALLELNPNDNQGARYMVAPCRLLQRDPQGALEEFEWFRLHYPSDVPDPHYLFSWGLACFLASRFPESAARFRSAMFANPYIIPLALKKDIQEFPIWHSNNLMELDYAREYRQVYGAMWRGRDEARRFLRHVWEDKEIQHDFSRWLGFLTQLEQAHGSDRWIPILERARRIERKRLSVGFFMRLKRYLDSQGLPPAPGVH